MKFSDRDLQDLRGLGPKSAAQLHQVGVGNPQQLIDLGAVQAYLRLKEQCGAGLNFLYALVGAIEDRDWREVAQT